MSDMKASGTPRHLWIVGIVALLWNLLGAMDYIMTEMKVETYMSQFTPEQLAFFYGLPAWVVAFWALAVWGGVLGAILLLMRKKVTVTVWIVSFLCLVVTMIHNFGFAGGADIVGGSGLFFSAVVFVVALGLIIYARRMAGKGVLV